LRDIAGALFPKDADWEAHGKHKGAQDRLLSLRGMSARGILMQLVSKIDESGTHGTSPHLIMAGHTARLNQWNRFDLKWRKALKKSGLEYFHAKEHWNHPFAVNAVKIADDNLLFGFVAKLSEPDYKKFYRDGPWGGKAQPDSMYGLCFRYCLSFVLQQAFLEAPSKDFVLNFIVEDGHPNSGAPTEIVRQLKRKGISGVSEFLGAAVTGEKTKVPGLQAADGLAFGAWHLEHRPVQLANVSPDVPVSKLQGKSLMKAPIFRCDINERELKIFKNGYFAHVDFRRGFGRKKTGGESR
jgi:hypothetical protein